MLDPSSDNFGSMVLTLGSNVKLLASPEVCRHRDLPDLPYSLFFIALASAIFLVDN